MTFITKWKTCGKLFLLSFILISFFTSSIFAQTAELLYNVESYSMSSGLHNGVTIDGGDTFIAFTGVIRGSEAPWLRVYFKDANLGKNSFIIMRSAWDGKEQKLDAISIEQWQNSSAYFNGFQIEIELHVAAFDKDIFFTINELAVGEFYGDDVLFFSICGPTDDRISSDQHATSRLMSIGCTAWIIPNGHFVSAGHCLGGSSSNTVQFQVPPSLPNGTPQHPGPEDQYSVDASTKVFVDGGVGNDWGTFEVFPNSVTGLMPKVAQGAYWPLVQDLGPDSIRITGYGVDSGVDNQTQQTHIGPNAGSSGTTMRYVTDTQGGNSGSPVIDGLTGNAVGVHTHGGCNSSGGNNNGTSTFNSAFWDAVEQGSGGCPVEPSSNPNPAHGATGVDINLASIGWVNGFDATEIEVWFDGSMVYSGAPVTSWSVPAPLAYSTTYSWRVNGSDGTCWTNGPTWTFTTMDNPSVATIFMEDFDGSWAGSWIITNNGGVCDWVIGPNARPYAPPGTSGNLLYADSDDCGSGTTMNTTATMDQGISMVGYTDAVLAFSHDLNYLSSETCVVEYSIDGGSTWTVIETFSADLIEVYTSPALTALDGQADVRFQFTYIAGWDWWWAIDNIFVDAVVPVELTSFAANVNENNVTLNWVTASEINNQGFNVERNAGNGFEKIGFVAGFGTTTETHSYTYNDNSLQEGTYTYRLKQVDYDGTFEYSIQVLLKLKFLLQMYLH